MSTILVFSVFSLKLFMNLKSRDNNIAHVPEVLAVQTFRTLLY